MPEVKVPSGSICGESMPRAGGFADKRILDGDTLRLSEILVNNELLNPISTMKSLSIAPMLLACLCISSCGPMLEIAIASAFDGNSSSRQEKQDVRRHLRHGDSIEQARRGAFEDEFFRQAGQW